MLSELADTKSSSISSIQGTKKSRYRRWEIVPTLFKYNPQSFRRIFFVGLVISVVTILTFDTAIWREMSGIYASHPFDVIIIIVSLSIMVGGAILLYPFLLVHYRLQVYVQEEAERLNARYLDGYQEFFVRLGKANISEYDPWPDQQRILDSMIRDNPDFQDFKYLYTTYAEIENQKWSEITRRLTEGEQTYHQAAKDILRGLIRATALENVEDKTYDLSSYEMPVSYCMVAVAFGFLIISVILLLGTGAVKIGDASINLVWAAGGFIGAYIYSLFPFLQRLTRGDMPPRAFMYYALRVFLGPIAVAVFGNLFISSIPESGFQFAAAVGLGSVPFWLLAEARKYILKRISALDSKKESIFSRLLSLLVGSEKEIGSQDVLVIAGITLDYADRLHEEGIMNIQNLAFCDHDNLGKRTMLNRDMLLDWKDQAILMLLTGNIQTERFKKSDGVS